MAERILRARRLANLSYEDLKRMRVVLKRAQYFITVNGKYYGGLDPDSETLYSALSEEVTDKKVMIGQLSLFG